MPMDLTKGRVASILRRGCGIIISGRVWDSAGSVYGLGLSNVYAPLKVREALCKGARTGTNMKYSLNSWYPP